MALAVPSRAMVTPSTSAAEATRTLAIKRWRIAATLTLLMVCVYFGFIALVAYRPALLAKQVQDGLSIGIILGALVIVAAWVLTYTYVRWANQVYDPALLALRAHHEGEQ